MQEHMLSTPVYQDVHALHIHHGRTLFLVESTQTPAARTLQQKIQDVDLDHCFMFQNTRNWAEQLQLIIARHLNQAQAGWHAVICGQEYFIWKADHALRQAGLLADEIARIRTEGQRQVYCVHCSHLQNRSDEDYCRCEQCGVDLLIRSHFSERLGAYMGVCAHAEHQSYAAVKTDEKELSHV